MAEKHAVPVEGGEEVAAVHHGAGSDRWIVFCHGFLSDKSGSYEGRCRRAVAEGFDAIRFDFRGCGESDGAFEDQDLTSRIADLRAVVGYFDPNSYVLFGSSFGGKVAFHAAASDDRVEAVVARAPVTHDHVLDGLREEVERAGEHRFETGVRVDGRFFDDLDRYDFAEVEATLSCPVAIFHGGEDGSVEPTHSFRVADELDGEVAVWKFEGEGHRFSRAAEARLRDATFHWLDAVLERRS